MLPIKAFINNRRVLTFGLGPAFNDPFSCFNWFDLSKFPSVSVNDDKFNSWVFTAFFILSTNVTHFRFRDFPLNRDLFVKSNNRKKIDV